MNAQPEYAPATSAELQDWIRDPASPRAFSALGTRPLLLVDAAQPADPDLEHWLRALPCPVVAIGEGPLAGVCDVLIASTAESAAIVRNVRRAPITAAVFVQLLRALDLAHLESALCMESLAYSTLQSGPEFARWRAASEPAARSTPSHEEPAVRATRHDATLTIELNRPLLRNAMTVEMRDALGEALELVLADDSIREVKISGRGKCFCTGGDPDEFGSAPDPATAHLIRRLTLPGRLLAACAARAEVRVHGACIGSGIEFPAFAARVVAAPDAWFQLPELRYGLIPGAGGCVSLARRIGRQRLARMVLSGERVNAQTALDWGLVDAIE